MNIVIIGANALALHIALLFSEEEHNVTILDEDQKQLDIARTSMDVAIRRGSGTDWQLLDDLLETLPDVLLALTENDEKNLASCAIAKHLGYKKTIARIKDSHFFNSPRLDFGKIFYVDRFIFPELLVAHNIFLQLTAPSAVNVQYYAQGVVQLRTFVLPEKFKKENINLKDLLMPKGIVIAFIARQENHEKKWIFPKEEDTLKKNDEVTCIGLSDSFYSLYSFLGLKEDILESVVIVGGSLTALKLAKELERQEISTKIIEKDYGRCVYLADSLKYATIIHHEGIDLDFYRSEKIGASESFIALTDNDEINILAALLAKEVNCKQVIAQVSSIKLEPLLKKHGVNHVISSMTIIADHLISRILSNSLTSITSLYEGKAEVMEIEVSENAQITGIPLDNLKDILPKDFLICIIQNRGRVMVAQGNRIISQGDTVIAVTHPHNIEKIKLLF
jgi:trk system potassium uptake protein